MYVVKPIFDERYKKKAEDSLEGRNSERRDPFKVFDLREESVKALLKESLLAPNT